MATMQPLTTIVHAFDYDTRKPEDAAAYAALREQLKDWPHKMRALGDYHALGAKLDGQTITLESTHLFENQWNTAPIAGLSEKGYRVFDWAEDAIFYNGNEQKHLRRGYWLEQTAEMKEARRNTVACGYCGHQEAAAKGGVFCDRCLDSPYLKAEEIYLLRLRPVDEDRIGRSRPPLSEAEQAHLLPLYKAAQLHGSTERGKKRIADQRARLESDYKRSMHTAETKYRGLLWLMDHGLNIENVIYYDHTDRFSFGWRQPVATAFLSEILDVISEFPYAYEIKCADGRKLEGGIG